MTRAHYVKKARKDNPAVKAGEPYWWWQFRYQPKRYSRTAPRPSQLTQSEFLSQMYAIEEGLEDAHLDVSDIEFAAGAFREAAEQLRDLASETQDKLSNMPDALQDGDTGQMLQERADACESMADELDAAAESLDAMDPQPETRDFKRDEEAYDDAVAEWESEAETYIEDGLNAASYLGE